MNKDVKVLVFGGSGFVGLSLVQELAKSGFSNLIIADIERPKVLLPSSVEFQQADILSSGVVLSLMSEIQPEIVYNFAAFASLDKAISSPKKTFELNVIGNINVIEACIKCDVKLFVFASSAYAMSDKGSFYGISKLTSEKIVEEYGTRFNLNYSILRYGSIYAAADFENNYLFQVIKEAILNGVLVNYGNGEEVREYVHVADVSKLAVEVLGNKDLWNAPLILTGTERLKRRELFEMIREILGDESLRIEHSREGGSNHYMLTPYSFQGTSARKMVANPHYDMGQGILDCIHVITQMVKEGDE